MNSKQIAVVTGANGFVGSHLVDYLLSKNFEVRCIVRKSSNIQWLEEKNVKEDPLAWNCLYVNKYSKSG